MAAVVHAVLSAASQNALPIAVDGRWERLLAGTLTGVLSYPLALALLARKQLRLFVEQLAAMVGVARVATFQAKTPTIGA
jgi:hypothetical protein